MNRKTTRLIMLASLVMTAGLVACHKNEAKSSEPVAHTTKTAGGATVGDKWGSGPYTEWEPITPPSKQGK